MMQPFALNHNAPSGDQSPLRIGLAGLEALKPNNRFCGFLLTIKKI